MALQFGDISRTLERAANSYDRRLNFFFVKTTETKWLLVEPSIVLQLSQEVHFSWKKKFIYSFLLWLVMSYWQ